MQSHPMSLLAAYTECAAKLSDSPFTFEFSKYLYVPQAIAESRKPFYARASEVEAEFFRQKESLAENEEIALHSRMNFADGTRAHIPLVDMGCSEIESHFPKLSAAFQDFGIERFEVFNSGRSFHVYGLGLLKNDQELVRFMGRILLLNLPHQERVIDERWVGHRLMAGYLTLRWTNNNPHYKSLPVRIMK